MSMSTWAEKEIEIACARERAVSKNKDEWDYGCACYESAYKAFKSLMEDGHSGCSIGITKNILIRLIDGKPLTPIEDTPDVWNEVHALGRDGNKKYQCSRMSSLFKTVHEDGTVTYSDVRRVSVTYTDNPSVSWSSGQATRMIDEMFPIAMPYCPPTKGYMIYGEDFLVYPENGDYDTVGYMYAVDPSGERIKINRYFAEKNGEFTEICFEEYSERKKMANKRACLKNEEY